MDNLSHEFCVIGDPIGHSLSPDIHMKVFEILDLDYHYTKQHVLSDQLADFVHDSKRYGRPGFNVTIPHKEKIMALIDKIDPFAERIGAVNTVWNKGGTLIGYNTDVHGCRIALERGGWKSNGTVILLGAGGAARAVLSALHTLHASKVLLYDIDPNRCQILADHFSDLRIEFDIAGKWEQIEAYLPNASLLINASPVGMWPNIDRTPFENIALFHSDITVFDLVPKPFHTRLLKDAQRKGATIIPGLSMLVAQALAAEEIWLQRQLPPNTHTDVTAHMMEVIESS